MLVAKANMIESQNESEERLRRMTKDFIEKISPMLFAPISMQQFATTQDKQAIGPIWVSRGMLQRPEDHDAIKVIVQDAIRHGGFGKERVSDFTVEDVNVQWTAYRPSASEEEPEPLISEREKYESMMQDVSTDITILYAHGGFYYTGNPASTRRITLELARQTGGRCISVDYRLAPQDPFPSAIVDLFLTYLSLLHPLDDHGHTGVLPNNIVLAGDSSGGNLALSLLSLLQYIRDHRSGRVRFNGKMIDVPLPAGIATASAQCDHTNSFDSHTRNKPFDIFHLDMLPYLQPNFQADSLWPTKPARGSIYCEISTLTHPLVSIAVTPSWSASNMPPIFFAYGQEKLTDEGYYVAQKAKQNGTTVQFYQYDALPHNFGFFFPRLPQSKHMLEQWGQFCRRVVQNPESLKSQDIRYAANDVDFKGAELVLPVSLDEKERIMKMEDRAAKCKVWTGTAEASKL